MGIVIHVSHISSSLIGIEMLIDYEIGGLFDMRGILAAILDFGLL